MDQCCSNMTETFLNQNIQPFEKSYSFYNKNRVGRSHTRLHAPVHSLFVPVPHVAPPSTTYCVGSTYPEHAHSNRRFGWPCACANASQSRMKSTWLLQKHVIRDKFSSYQVNAHPRPTLSLEFDCSELTMESIAYVSDCVVGCHLFVVFQHDDGQYCLVRL